jgi:hypothetical protein
MKILVTFIISMVLLIAIFLMSLYWQRTPYSPENALEIFYSYNGAEDELMDPLLLAGRKVIPLLIEQIKHQNMPKRRYAILAVGHLGDSSSLPILEKILTDSSENNYFRCDALLAIAMINSKRGYSLAKRYSKETEEKMTCLSKTSQEILTRIPLEKRTYWEALLGRHQ